jgi:N-acetylglutamate synthase-like GNAT family acetyltransferase
MEIREAIIDDIKSIQELSLQLGYNYPIKKMKLKLNQILNNPEHIILIALKNNQVIGYIHVEIYRVLYADDLLNILGIVVDKSCRNQGVGTTLLKSTEKLSIKLNCRGIRANSGASREKAHLFYKRNGFDNEKDQKRFIKYIEARPKFL